MKKKKLVKLITKVMKGLVMTPLIEKSKQPKPAPAPEPPGQGGILPERRCPHGHKTTRLDAGDGWFQDAATGCKLCTPDNATARYKL